MFFLCAEKTADHKRFYQKFKRKEECSLPGRYDAERPDRGRISLSVPHKRSHTEENQAKKSHTKENHAGEIHIRGSLTVEAACVLPVFIYMILVFLYFFQVVHMAGSVAGGLQEAGKKMAIYAYAKEAAVKGEASEVSRVVSLSYAKARIYQKTGRDAPAVYLLKSSIGQENGIIDLVAEYRFRWRLPFFFSPDLPIGQRARVRAWTGRSKQTGTGKDGCGGEKVYVTVNGKVYHKDRECTHIRLSVHQVPKESIQNLRNADGGKYYPCRDCKGADGASVYITDTGNRYHSSVTCSGIKRGVIAVDSSRLEGWRPCSRCGG